MKEFKVHLTRAKININQKMTKMASSISDNNHNHNKCCCCFYNNKFLLLSILMTFTLLLNVAAATQDVLPHLCDTVKCPPMSEITCPNDSDIRDESIHPIALLHASTAAPAEESYNTSAIPEELYAQCCLAKKCVCKTCYIPDCSADGEVVFELLPESMDTPGQCCGEYECHKEPNCTEVRDTESYWLTDCQRCKCYSGERICQVSCDEGMKKDNAICNSKTLNTFFEHGDSWKDGCYECECVNGEEKCVMPFCRSVNCPPHRQVILKDSCCPICWPKGIAMPNGDEDYDDDGGEEAEGEAQSGNHNYDDDNEPAAAGVLQQPTDDYADNDIDTLPNIKFDDNAQSNSTTTVLQVSTATSTTAALTTTTTTAAPQTTANQQAQTTTLAAAVGVLSDAVTTTAAPCQQQRQDAAPATYQVYPEVVEVVRQTQQNDLLYGIIGCLALAVVIMAAWNIHLRAKQRSYRPVSNFDDNFNKMSSNIKKMNDYV